MPMDSGNSSSMQSSSGGDEEYDSRAESISAFFTAPSSLAALSHHHTRLPTTSLPHHPPPPSSSSSLFDPLSVYLDSFARSPPTPNSSNPLLNLDMSWARGVGGGADPSCTDVVSLMGSAPPSSNNSSPTPIGPSRGLYTAGVNISPLPSSSQPPQQQPSSVPPLDDHHQVAAGSAAPPRSSKKRSRASRRASTTVLTTDTSNFRAMVQEFTGLPAPPFASSPFPRSRFDLFHAAASSVMRSTGVSDAASPHYLLRPFAQQLPMILASSSSSSSFSAPAITGTLASTTSSTIPATVSAIAAAAAATAATSTSITSAISSNTTAPVATTSTNVRTNTTSGGSYPLPSDHLGLGSQRHSLLNLFNYPSLLQPSPTTTYNSGNVPIPGSGRAPPGIAMMPSTEAAVAGDFAVCSGLPHGHVDAHSGAIPSLTESMGLPSSSSGCGGGGGDDVLLRWVEGPGSSHRGDRGQFRAAGGGSCTSSQRGSICKLNYAGSGSSEYHAEKGSESVPTARGEGMMDSWMCSSD